MDGREHIIVCGIDGSPGGQRALEWAMDEAIRRNCKLRVVTAFTWDLGEAVGGPSSSAAAQNEAKQIQDIAVSGVLTDTDNPPEVEQVLVRGAASESLVQVGPGRGADRARQPRTRRRTRPARRIHEHESDSPRLLPSRDSARPAPRGAGTQTRQGQASRSRAAPSGSHVLIRLPSLRRAPIEA